MPAFGTILTGDALAMLRTLPDQSVHCCVTSPPYWGLRDYGVAGQIGLEPTVEEHIDALTRVFRKVRRVLHNDGTLWVNYGDMYSHDGKWGGSTSGKHNPELHGATGIGRLKVKTNLGNKNFLGLPWRLAFALQADGWYLRSDIIWHKPNCMPESVKDRPTRAHEYLFLLSKAGRYYYDHKAVREPSAPSRKGNAKTFRGGGVYTGGRSFDNSTMTYPLYTRNRRSVWSVATHPFPDAHFATFPPDLIPDLIRPCALAGCPAGGVVLDPFFGTGTVGVVCVEEARRYLGIEINPDYVAMAERRIGQARPKGPQPLSLLDMGVA